MKTVNIDEIWNNAAATVSAHQKKFRSDWESTFPGLIAALERLEVLSEGDFKSQICEDFIITNLLGSGQGLLPHPNKERCLYIEQNVDYVAISFDRVGRSISLCTYKPSDAVQNIISDFSKLILEGVRPSQYHVRKNGTGPTV